jgi:glycerol-3-phosphate acyltransferase PlsY
MSGQMVAPVTPSRTRGVPAPLVLGVSWLSGSIPFSNIGAHLTTGVDLREVGTGTVSGTSLHEVAGFGPLAVAGVLELAKGAVGPLLAGRRRPALAAAAAAAAVAGHNWSPFLKGAGGRGISPATGALLATAPAGAAVLLGGLAAGRMAKATGFGSFLADLALVPVVRRVHGRDAALAAGAVLVPIAAKRLAGNRPPPADRRWATLRARLLFDRDPEDGAS